MKISIDDIKNSKNQSLKIDFANEVSDLDTLGLCDRCLKDFVQKIDVDVDETYKLGRLDSAVNGHSGQEIELKDGDFVTELDGDDEIDVEDLIYQSVTLNIPNPCVCDINCIGDPEMEKYIKKEISDPRLEVFKNLKINKLEEGK